MSKHLSNNALKAVIRIGDIMIPKNGEFPSYSEFGGYEYIDETLECIPENDVKTLDTIFSVLSFMPTFVLKWLVNKMIKSYHQNGMLSHIFRQLNFAIKGLILSTYYTEKSGKNFNETPPLDIIGYHPVRIED